MAGRLATRASWPAHMNVVRHHAIDRRLLDRRGMAATEALWSSAVPDELCIAGRLSLSTATESALARVGLADRLTHLGLHALSR